jgi:hypothetical protein
VLDSVCWRGTDAAPEFVEAPASTDEALHAVLHKVITRLMKLLTRRGVLVEEEGSTYMTDNDGDSNEARVLRPLQVAACTYRIAFGPRAGQKVLTLQGAMPRQRDFKQTLCADMQGFSLHAAVRCGANDRQTLEQLCRYIARPALANERVQTNAAGQALLKLKTPWRDGTTHLVMSPLGSCRCELNDGFAEVRFICATSATGRKESFEWSIMSAQSGRRSDRARALIALSGHSPLRGVMLLRCTPAADRGPPSRPLMDH